MSDEKKDDGGPAFPHGPMGDSMTFQDGRTVHQCDASPGMTLRDWFAGQVIQGIVLLCSNEDLNLSDPEEMFAKKAYCLADAMIEARKR